MCVCGDNVKSLLDQS